MLRIFRLIFNVRWRKMKYSKQEIQNAISGADLSSRHQKSLREVTALRSHPLCLGYLVYAVGIACLIPFGYFIWTTIKYPELISAEGIQKGGGILFLLSLFLMSGAQTYMSRIRASRAVSELLMKPKDSEQIGAP